MNTLFAKRMGGMVDRDMLSRTDNDRYNAYVSDASLKGGKRRRAAHDAGREGPVMMPAHGRFVLPTRGRKGR